MNYDDVSDFDLEAYLSSKGLAVKYAGSQIHTHCMWCGEDPSKRGRLYINNSHTEYHGLYKCMKCGEKGNLRLLMRKFGDEVEAAPVDERTMRINNTAANYYHEHLTDEIRTVLHNRGLTDETIDAHKLGYAKGGTELYSYLRDKNFESDEIIKTGLCGFNKQHGNFYDAFEDSITIPYLAHGIAQQVRARAADPAVDKGKYKTPAGAPVKLFNVDQAWSAEEIIICEGEFDAMILEQLGFAAVGVPGTTTWKAAFNGYIKTAKRVWVMYDPDEDGQKNSVKVVDLIGGRAKNVLLPVPENVEPKRVDPTYMVTSEGWEKKNFEALFKAVARKNSLLISPREALVQWENLQGKDGFKLGFETLDNWIRPGLIAGQIMIPLAKTNTGKTMFLINIFQRAANIQPDAKILFLSLEQNAGDWFERARRIWNFYNRDCEPEKVHEETLNFWDNRLRIVEKSRPTEAEVHTALDDYEDQMGHLPDLVAVDYLGYWAQGIKGKDRYEQVGNAVMALKGIAKDRKIAMIAPHQVNRSAEFGGELSIDQARDSGAVEETADFALGMWAPDTMKGVSSGDMSGELVLKIGKTRHGGKHQEMRLQFGQMTLVYVPIEEHKHVHMLKNELKWAEDPLLTWQDAIHAHRTGIPLKRGL